MQRDLIVKGRSLGGASDLTLLAPLKPGFIEALESVTHKTRTKRVLETLHGARMSVHEYHNAPLLSDAVERVGAIQSVRVAVLEPEDKVLLAVTFDGSWDSYIRLLWEKVGPLLDLIFCDTIDYVCSDRSFEEWMGWARRVQVETGLFYAPESTSVDTFYHRRTELVRTRSANCDLPVVADAVTANELDEVRTVMPSAEEVVERFVRNQREPLQDDPPYAQIQDVRMVRERIRNGFEGLAALYRLVELYPPITEDGAILRSAATNLLREFVNMNDDNLIFFEIQKASVIGFKRFPRQVAWLFPDGHSVARPRTIPPFPKNDAVIPPNDLKDIQGGIIEAYDPVTHGLLLMLSFDTPKVAKDFLHWAESNITKASDAHADSSVIFHNVYFTPAGLRAIGMDEDSLTFFPEEFRQGMEARAGLLGDVRSNHPRRWELPKRIDALNRPGRETIEMNTVHAVLQLRCSVRDGDRGRHAIDLADNDHPLHSAVAQLRRKLSALTILAIQPLTRHARTVGTELTAIDQFGYADGDSQPDVLPRQTVPSAGTPSFDLNRAHLGEVVLGHPNAADDVHDPVDRLRWLRNGSFLVARKYQQFPDLLDRAVSATAAVMQKQLSGHPSLEYLKEIVYGKLVGRSRLDGTPLAPHKLGTKNNFVYTNDAQGLACPLHAHIRRAHPRNATVPGMRPPRLVRRSMSYGPAPLPIPGTTGLPATSTRAPADRGTVFMVFNASIAEQFEVVQRWLVGGNSTGSSSTEGSCPIVGVPENGIPRHFRFEHLGQVFSVQLEDQMTPFETPPTVTRLDWGLYLFTPSMSALRALEAVASRAAHESPPATVPWELQRGRSLVAALKELEKHPCPVTSRDAWKAAIEDPESIDRLDGAAIWATIREDHGGVMKTSYGTLVASLELVADVFLDPHARYSVCGQLERMKKSFGEISLGMDAGPIYQQQSGPINEAIEKLKKKDTFRYAFRAAKTKIDSIVKEADTQAKEALDPRLAVAFDVREIVDEVLATLCEKWFGLADDPTCTKEETDKGCFARGSTDWNWRPGQRPLYPGHFTAMSRYMFQPYPGATVVELGEAYGQALRVAMRTFVAAHRAAGTKPKVERDSAQYAPIALATFDHPLGLHDDDFVARNMVGVLMGFNPTIIGAVLNVVRELQREGRFAALRVALAGNASFAAAKKLIQPIMERATQMRPMPQIGWRTSLKPHRLGSDPTHAVDVQAGDRIILGIVSGTQQSLADGQPDCKLMFGGDRSKSPHPTHACPGYEAAIGAMLGTLSALLTRPEAIRQGPALLTFQIEGPSSYVTLPPRHPDPGPPTKPIPQMPTGTRENLVLAWGDSWVDFRIAGGTQIANDLRDYLEHFGYRIPNDFCRWTSWPKIETMAASPDAFCQFIRDQVQTSDRSLDAILLSAGGNDSTQGTLQSLINRRALGVPTLDPVKVANHITRMEGHYRTVIARIRRTLADLRVRDVPIVLHGYDYPYSRGTGYDGWLQKPFEYQGYKGHEREQDAAMVVLIDALNAMQAGLGVVHVDLRGTIQRQWPANPLLAWYNDLHPMEVAFRDFALQIDAAIQQNRP